MAKIPVKTWHEFEGERVFVAYNLHACRVGRDPKPGEACFTLRYKPGGKVQAHLTDITLADIRPKLLPGTLKRIRDQGTREVCCYIEGTVVSPSRAKTQGPLRRASFNPFKADHFYLTDTGEALQQASYALFSGRGMHVLGLGGVQPNPSPPLDVPMVDVRKLKAKLLR